MRTVYWCSILMMVLISGGISQEGRMISVEQAEAIVRQFEGKPNLSLPKPTTYQAGDRVLHHFRLPNGDEYRVNAFTGEIQSVFYGSRQARKATRDILANMLPPSKLEAIAWQQARRLYKGFDAKKMVLINKYFDGEAYVFEFRQQLPNGAFTDNWCGVRVRADTGDLLFYSQTFVGVPQGASRIPKIGRERALEEVRRSIGLVEITCTEESRLEFRRGRLTWSFMVEGPLPDGTTYLWSALVDADTVAVLETNKAPASPFRQPLRGHTMVGGILLKRNFGPLAVRGRLFIPSEVFLALGVKIKKQNAQIVLLGEKAAVAKKEDHAYKNGRLFLSPTLLLKVMPDFVITVHEDLSRKSVNIVCANKEGLNWLMRHGKVKDWHLNEQRFQKAYERMLKMRLVLE